MNTEITIPTQCPTCSSTLERVNAQLFCRNPDCAGKVGKKMEHYCKTLKIKGLGPRTIEKLQLNSIYDLYKLGEEIFEVIGEKTGAKILEEIQNSYNNSLFTFIHGLGIPLIGKSATNKLSTVVSKLEDITDQTCEEAGLGKVATNNLITWLTSNYSEELSALASKFTSTKPTSIKPTGFKKVCISGKLSSFKTKNEAKQELQKYGFEVVDSVTKTTDFVLTEQQTETSKIKKAKQLGLPILTYEELINVKQPT